MTLLDHPWSTSHVSRVPNTPDKLIAVIADSLALTGADRAWLEEVCEAAVPVRPEVHLAIEGKSDDHVHIILNGFAVRYRCTDDGRQQNLGFIIPGNFCDLHAALLDRHDHNIKTSSNCMVAAVPRQDLLGAASRSEGLMRAFWWCALLNEALLREWIFNLGSKQADERIAHVFCELHARLETVGLVQSDNSFHLPFTQEDLANTVGTSNVQVNRRLRFLRETGLMQFRQSRVRIPDLNKLRAYARFDPTYLHLGANPSHRS